MRESKAYAKSIYLMLGMPYLLLTAFGIYAYRATRGMRSVGPESESLHEQRDQFLSE